MLVRKSIVPPKNDRLMSKTVPLLLFLLTVAWAAPAQDLYAIAKVQIVGSWLRDSGEATELRLSLDQPVPFRVFHLDNPRRIVMDFNEVDWSGLDPAYLDLSDRVTAVRVGVFQPGWSRLVMDIDEPMVLDQASVEIAPSGRETAVSVRLKAADAVEFANSAGPPEGADKELWARLNLLPPQRPRPRPGEHPLIVMLDPGHGGIDPGAERSSVKESDLMLTFALELRDLLVRTGGFQVILTRNEDVFVPLETRVALARRAGADLFLSLHADALAEGRAEGSTVYTLSETASDVASQQLAERHDRADLLAGVDLSEQDDEIATILMELARTETRPRTELLADHLVEGLSVTVGTHKRPKLSAGFSVLKAPDIPSVLIELGFLSSDRDMKNLRDRRWRNMAAQGIRDALLSWQEEDASNAPLVRK